MKNLSIFSAPLILTSIIFAACQPQLGQTPEIFDAIKSAEYFEQNATQITCETNPDFPSSNYEAMCLKIGSQIIESTEQAGEMGLALGKQIAVSFEGTEWELNTDHPDGLFYQKIKTADCFDRLFLDILDPKNFDALPDDYPFTIEIVLGFYKARDAVCPKA